MGIQQPRTVSFVRTKRWGKEHFRAGGTDHVPRQQQTCRCLRGDKVTIPDTPPQECLRLETLGDSWDLRPSFAWYRQLLSQAWAVLDCPSQCFTLIAVGGMRMGSAIKEIPASYLNLAKLSWRSNLGELIVCSEKICLLALSKEISFCLIKHP